MVVAAGLAFGALVGAKEYVVLEMAHGVRVPGMEKSKNRSATEGTEDTEKNLEIVKPNPECGRNALPCSSL
jgi:hypothetical protein